MGKDPAHACREPTPQDTQGVHSPGVAIEADSRNGGRTPQKAEQFSPGFAMLQGLQEPRPGKRSLISEPPAPLAPAQSSVAARSAHKLFLPIAALLHFTLVVIAGRFRWDVVIMDGALLAFALRGGAALGFARMAFPLWLTGVLYLDVQAYLLPFKGAIHTGDLFALDAVIFPAPGGVPWPAYFAEHTHAVADFFCGLAYAVYLFQFFGVLLWLYWSDRPAAKAMAWCFFAANVLGIIGYVVYPAAPPWYVLDYGPGPADLSALPSAAGAARFDALLGIDYFRAFYAKNPNVFGAMPSLHVAYPVAAAAFLWGRGRLPRILGVGFALWVAFSAVYLVHHYLLDVVAGVAVGLCAFAVVRAAGRIVSARASDPGAVG